MVVKKDARRIIMRKSWMLCKGKIRVGRKITHLEIWISFCKKPQRFSALSLIAGIPVAIPTHDEYRLCA